MDILTYVCYLFAVLLLYLMQVMRLGAIPNRILESFFTTITVLSLYLINCCIYAVSECDQWELDLFDYLIMKNHYSCLRIFFRLIPNSCIYNIFKNINYSCIIWHHSNSRPLITTVLFSPSPTSLLALTDTVYPFLGSTPVTLRLVWLASTQQQVEISPFSRAQTPTWQDFL